MKKHIGIMLLITAMLFVFSGCGGASGDSSDNKEAKEPKKATTIFNTWISSDIVYKENGKQVMDAKSCKEFFDMDINEFAKLRMYEDGNGDIAVFREELSAMKWSRGEEKNQYVLESVYAESDKEKLNATFKDGRVILSIPGYDTVTDGDGNKTTTESETIITLEPAKEKESRHKGINVELTNEEIRAMSNFMNEGLYLNADGILYGTFQPMEFAMTELELDKDKIGMKEPKVIRKNCRAEFLTQKDDYIYAILRKESNSDKGELVKFKKGTEKIETIYKGRVNYLQIVGDKLYFTDENHNFCSTDLNGKEKSIIIEKECYYTYFLNRQWIIYQDDDDGETLHLYNCKTKEDIKITDGASYAPIVNGECVYYVVRKADSGEDEDMDFNFARYNMYSCEGEVYEKDFTLDFFILDDRAYFGFGGGPYCKLPDQWNKLYDKAFGGMDICAAYADDDIFIRKFADSFEAYCYKRGDEYKGDGNNLKLKIK